ncbi:MAG: thioredoxin domain-containing protein [Actinomycetes bacterium]
MNRLAHETSPYLRQHADNPVDWYPWGEEAFAAARSLDLPILLSVGYSACHWCHVMAHESFEHPETAAVMNDLFINVKVDREERPDVDAVYMTAVQAMTGRGGWPMTVFMTAEGVPFYGGTYFPPEDRHGMSSFTRVMHAISNAWTTDRENLAEQGEQLRELIQRSATPPEGAASLTDHLPMEVLAPITSLFDSRLGGFGRAPKFPQAMTIDLLLRLHANTENESALEMATTSLDRMADGGIYDHLGGGFARYSTDDKWLVPHFEKMLYDQALLLGAYLRAFCLTGNNSYRQVVEETIAYVLRDLATPDAGWASAEDADSEGIEGKFYLWSPTQIHEACADSSVAQEIIDWFQVTDAGNFTDPHTAYSGTILANSRPRSERPEAVTAALPLLLEYRAKRVRPGLDDKVLLAWNAWFLRSLVESAAALGRQDWMDAATSNARFLLSAMRSVEGRLLRSWQNGRAHLPAYAEDYAALLGALISLAELDDANWLTEAIWVADDLIELFGRDEGGFYTTGTDQERLVARTLDLQDNATPAANSLAADALLRLADLTGVEKYRETAISTLRLVVVDAYAHPTAFAFALGAIERATTPAVEIAFIGDASELVQVAASRVIPSSAFLWARSESDAHLSPLLEGRTEGNSRGTAFVCESNTCRMPVTDRDSLNREIDLVLANRKEN